MNKTTIFGDEELVIQPFPQRPEGIEESNGIECDRFFILYPQINNKGGKGSAVLLIPDGLSKKYYGESSYTVIALNSQKDYITRRHIDHLPLGRKKARDNIRSGGAPLPALKERLKLVSEAFLSSSPGEFFAIGEGDIEKHNNPDLSILFDDEKAARFINNQVVYKIDEHSGQLSQVDGHSSRALGIDVIRKFVQDNVDREIADTMQRLSGQQTTEVFSYLNVRLSRTARKKLQKTSLNEKDIQRQRISLFRSFPLLASDFRRFDNHDAAKDIGKNEVDVNKIVSSYWSTADHKLEPQHLSLLEGLSEEDVTKPVAENFYQIAPYIAEIDNPDQAPKTPKDWVAFAKIVEIDRYYASHFFRRKGQTVKECLKQLYNNESTEPWLDIAETLCDRSGHLNKAAFETVLQMASRVGTSVLAPILLNMNEQEEIAPNIKKTEVIAFCDVITPTRREELSKYGKKYIEGRGLSVIGDVYKNCSLKDLIHMQRHFSQGQQEEWDRNRRTLAVMERFSHAAGSQRVEALPRLPDKLQKEFSAYEIVPISSAGEAVQQLTLMKSQQAWRILTDMIYMDLHFIFCVKSHTGSVEAMCILEEVPRNDGILEIKLKDNNQEGAPFGYLTKDNNEGALPYQLTEKVAQYINYVNKQQLKRKPFKEARERLRLQAERLEGERATIGHDRHAISENMQAANCFKDSCPRGLKTRAFGGLRFSCPEINEDGVYDSFRRMLRIMDPKLSPISGEPQAKRAHLRPV